MSSGPHIRVETAEVRRVLDAEKVKAILALLGKNTVDLASAADVTRSAISEALHKGGYDAQLRICKALASFVTPGNLSTLKVLNWQEPKEVV